jgi:GNAT superfamily N-acetyltransferase
MIRSLLPSDFDNILKVINHAAHAYKGIIPTDRWKEPYMSAEELKREIETGVRFLGWTEGRHLLAVAGIQALEDTTLIRHAYVLPGYQRSGIGTSLLEHLLELVATSEVLVGTWADATWAIQFYERQGFKLVSSKEKDGLLQTYWNIPERQIETSVVLRLIHSHLH